MDRFDNERVLIVGEDGKIGGRLSDVLRARECPVRGTTRREGRSSPASLFLDLARPETFAIPQETTCALLLAAVTDVGRCEREGGTRRINVDGAVALGKRLLDRGVFTVFASSAVIFGGESDFPGENDAPLPMITYAKQKAEAETLLSEYARTSGRGDLFAIARITRIVSPWDKPCSDWLQKWKMNQATTPFTDLQVSPITLEYAVDGLSRILLGRHAGPFHFSGGDSVDYAFFCMRLAERLGVDKRLIKPVASGDVGVTALYKPRCAALGMKRTADVLGLEPQPLDDVVDAIRDLDAGEKEGRK